MFDNTLAGMNKPTSGTYFYYLGAWRKVGLPVTTSCDGDLVDPGAALIIRKANGTVGNATWTENAPF